MPYTYSNVDNLDKTEKVGSEQCVALVQYYAGAPNTAKWDEGESVLGNKNIAKGTAIATFVDGKYPNLSHGNHAALFISQETHGIWVMDQWIDNAPEGKKKKPYVSKRFITSKGKWKDGTYVDPSNNADAFSVIK